MLFTNINTIDMMTYDTPTPGDPGFNPHKDKGDAPDFRGTTQDQGVTSDAGFDTGGGSSYSRGDYSGGKSHHW